MTAAKKKFKDLINDEIRITNLYLISNNFCFTILNSNFADSSYQIVSWGPYLKKDEIINKSKASILSFLNSVLALLKSDPITKREDQLNMVLNFFWRTIDELQKIHEDKLPFINQMTKTNDTCYDANYSYIITCLVIFVQKLANKNFLLRPFFNESKRVAIDVILPYLVATQVEVEKMQEDPEDYQVFMKLNLSNSVSK